MVTALDVIAASLADMGDLDPATLADAEHWYRRRVVAVASDPTDVGVLAQSSPLHGAVHWHTGEVDDASRPNAHSRWVADVCGTGMPLVIVRGDVDLWWRRHHDARQVQP